jgi:hypothetical protein
MFTALFGLSFGNTELQFSSIWPLQLSSIKLSQISMVAGLIAMLLSSQSKPSVVNEPGGVTEP